MLIYCAVYIKKMKNKDLIKYLKKFELNAEVIISNDEELNMLFDKPVIAYYGEETDLITKIVIYPDTSSYKDDEFYDESKSEYKSEILEQLKVK